MAFPRKVIHITVQFRDWLFNTFVPRSEFKVAIPDYSRYIALHPPSYMVNNEIRSYRAPYDGVLRGFAVKDGDGVLGLYISINYGVEFKVAEISTYYVNAVSQWTIIVGKNDLIRFRLQDEWRGGGYHANAELGFIPFKGSV